MYYIGVYILHYLEEKYNNDHVLMLVKLKIQRMIKIDGYNVNISENYNIRN